MISKECFFIPLLLIEIKAKGIEEDNKGNMVKVKCDQGTEWKFMAQKFEEIMSKFYI